MSPVELNPTANPAAANSPAPEKEHTPNPKNMTIAQIAAQCLDSQPLSVQSVYAGMQLEQAKLCKDAAQRKAKDMQEIQEKQAMIAQLIQRSRGSQAVNGDVMPQEIVNYMKELNLPVEGEENKHGSTVHFNSMEELRSYIAVLEKKMEDATAMEKMLTFEPFIKMLKGAEKAGTTDLIMDSGTAQEFYGYAKHFGIPNQFYIPTEEDKKFSDALIGKMKDDVTIYKMDKDKWDYNLKSLTNYQEQVGSKTQSTMVSLQDFLGQFNSYLQGANAAISEAIRLQSKINAGEQ